MLIASIGPLQIADPVAPDPPPPVIDTVGTLVYPLPPLTILTAIFYIISLYFLTNYYPINDAIFKTIFIGLASLTFPHILLEYLLEKNEK